MWTKACSWVRSLWKTTEGKEHLNNASTRSSTRPKLMESNVLRWSWTTTNLYAGPAHIIRTAADNVRNTVCVCGRCIFGSVQCSSNINKRVGRETTVNRRIVGWILSGGGVNHYPTWVCHMASHGQAYWRGKDRIKPLQRHSQFHGQGKTKSSKTES